MKRFYSLIIVTTLTLLSLGFEAHAQSSSATLEYVASEASVFNGQEFTVDVKINNPAAASIISVRSWLSYDPSILEAINVDTSASPFTLSAPGEDAVSQGEGRVKIGRSNISGGFKDLEGTVATVRFKAKTANPVTAVISAYDYQVSELGHTNVNIIEGGFPLNILGEKPKDLMIQLNPGAVPAAQPVVIETPQPVNPIGGSAVNITIPRVNGLKANTGSGYVDLQWEPVNGVAGYYVYYGKNSGAYTRQRNVGNVTSTRIDGLLNGETYYFAVTAYNALNQEGDYSNEVGIIVNQPLSSTSPFAGLLDAYLAQIPAGPETGPMTAWLLFSATGLAGSVLFRKKQI